MFCGGKILLIPPPPSSRPRDDTAITIVRLVSRPYPLRHSCSQLISQPLLFCTPLLRLSRRNSFIVCVCIPSNNCHGHSFLKPECLKSYIKGQEGESFPPPSNPPAADLFPNSGAGCLLWRTGRAGGGARRTSGCKQEGLTPATVTAM
jgi:hypothetical protein